MPNATRQLRSPLTRQRIVAAAVELADVSGIDAVTMRSLAAHLGFEVMSLYNHVANKDDLLDGMVDVVAAEIEEPPLDMPWRPAVRMIAMSVHDALLQHRWASPLWAARWPGPNRWRHMDTLLRILGTAGLAADRTDLGFHAITLHIQGFTQQQLDYAAGNFPEDEWYARFQAEVNEDEHPNVYAHMRHHRRSEPVHDVFAFVLDLILDGLERATESN